MKSEFEKHTAQEAVDAVERRWERNQRMARQRRLCGRFGKLIALVVLALGCGALWVRFTGWEIPKFESLLRFFNRDALEVANPESRRLYDESLERLMTGTVKYVSDMPEDLRLKNAKPGVGYDVLTSDKNGSVVLYALLRGEDGKLSVNRLSSDRAPRRVTGADLRAACAGKPYLVAVGGAVYLFGSSDLADVARLRGKVR